MAPDTNLYDNEMNNIARKKLRGTIGIEIIIPRARMDSESIAHLGSRNNCFSKVQLVGQKQRDKTTLGSKTRFSRHCFGFQSWRFSLLVGYNI